VDLLLLDFKFEGYLIMLYLFCLLLSWFEPLSTLELLFLFVISDALSYNILVAEGFS